MYHTCGTCTFCGNFPCRISKAVPPPRLHFCVLALGSLKRQVVAKVVGRQDLAGGMGASRREIGGGGGNGAGDGMMNQGSMFPLSEEERDVRLAELMSFGVDLPNETLILLLRFVRLSF